jgi:hypothetical protein
MNIILGVNGYLGSFLSLKLKNSIGVVKDDITLGKCCFSNETVNNNKINYKKFIENYNSLLYKNYNIIICVCYENIYNIILDLLPNSKQINKFILISSAVIYDNIDKKIYQENDSNMLESDDNYINSVKNNEFLFDQLLGKKIIFRCGTMYGFSPNLNANRGINRMIYSSLFNNKIKLNNNNLRKSFVSLNDIYNAINLVLLSNIESNIFNLSSFSLPLHTLGKLFKNKFDTEIEYVDFNKKEYEFYLDTSKLELYGWLPKSNFDSIIDDISWGFKWLNKLTYDNNIIWENKLYCRCCNSKSYFEIFDLDLQPPPNRLSDNYYKLLSFPLRLIGCNNCFHLQLDGIVNPNLMYKDYTYTSGTSKTMKEYFNNFVKSLGNLTNKKVLDIACNDGCLLDYFKLENSITYGIDPALNLVSKITNHQVYCDFFNKNSVNIFDTKFDIITAFNVFAHVDNINDFIETLDLITHNNSSIYIQTSQANMIINNEFDTIYHEHLSFFCMNSLIKFLSNTNFYLSDINIVNVHGGSYLFHLRKKNNNKNLIISENVYNRINYEIQNGLYDLNTYFCYKNNISIWVDKLINLLSNTNNKIIGVGASAKGITIMNFLKNKIKINYVIDESPLKINKKINSVNVNINDFNIIKTEINNLTFVLFAWNFKDELIKKIKEIRNNNLDIIINLFPLEII